MKKNQQVDGFEEDGEEITSGMMNPISAIEYFEKLESRRIYIFGDIDKDIILPVIYQIHILEQRGSDDIELVINSDGGYVVDCFALIDVMDASDCDFRVTVLGLAASAACLLASNGTPGKRMAGKNSEFMFHEVMGDVPALRVSDLASVKKDTERTQNKFTKIFSRNTGKSIKEIKTVFYGKPQDRYMSSQSAKKFGIVDKVMRQKRREG